MPKKQRRRPRPEAGEARSQSQSPPASATPPVSDTADAQPRARFTFAIEIEYVVPVFGDPSENALQIEGEDLQAALLDVVTDKFASTFPESAQVRVIRATEGPAE